MTYLAMAPHYWGTGGDKEAAITHLKAEGYRGPKKDIVVYEVPPEVSKVQVHEMGWVNFIFAEGTSEERKLEIINDPWKEV